MCILVITRLLTFSSDILAELDLPRSGIQEILLEYPMGFMDDFEKVDMPDSAMTNQTIMWYYSGQIHIRNMLNNIQRELYPPEGKCTWSQIGLEDAIADVTGGRQRTSCPRYCAAGPLPSATPGMERPLAGWLEVER